MTAITIAIDIAPADGWVKVVDTAKATFLLENQSASPVLVHHADAAPSGTVYAHTLGAGEAKVRMAPGNVYIKCLQRATTIVVSA